VDSVSGVYKEAELFIDCLSALPNLHTLEITTNSQYLIIKYCVDTLKKRVPQFQQVRTLVLPDAVHRLLRCCPNVEDLTCCTPPGMDFVKSLMAGGLNRITRFSVLRPSGSLVYMSLDIWSSRIHSVSCSPSSRRAHNGFHRDCWDLSRDPRIICRGCSKPDLRDPPSLNR